jgi:predicted transcriptional regulator
MLKDLEKGEDNVRSFEPKRLWGKQKEILRLTSSGLYTRKEIAELLGVTPQTVTNIVRSELGRSVLEMMEGAADQEVVTTVARLRALAPIAAAVQEELMMDDNTSNALKNSIANKVLDRTLGTPIARSMSVSVNAGLTMEDLNKIKQRAREIEKIHEEEILSVE